MRIEQIDPVGSIPVPRFNHLRAPFNNPATRRAVQMAVSQTDDLQTAVARAPLSPP
ncbi:hypothetical protein [Roseomonas rosulenta]|uniref:hypothetical protein n=1 Tax=Roseomonas rosulenta TaxID=2748667 RepID=UPI0018DF2A9A|nr:hypothetical protein [Roseomonas rosulenta]